MGGKIDAKLAVGAKGIKIPQVAVQANTLSQNELTNNGSDYYELSSSSDSIRAIPGGRWLIADLISENLIGKYQPDEHLCKIKIADNKISGSATGTLYFYPRDLSIEAIQTESRSLRILSKERPEKIAVAKALIAKYLKNLNQNYQSTLDGHILIGTSKINFRLEEVPSGPIASRGPVRRKR